MDPETYMKRALNKGVVFTAKDEAILEERAAAKLGRKEEKIDYYIQ
jgi:hypothetical protein